jgi:hypothetical protein
VWAAPPAQAQPTGGAVPGRGTERPLGVTVLAILAAVGGVLGVLGGLQLAGLGGSFGVWGLVLLVVSVGDLAVAWGCWMLRPWAWTLGVVVVVVQFGLALLNLVGANAVSGIISLVLNGAVLYYLDTPDVRRVFGRGPSTLGARSLRIATTAPGAPAAPPATPTAPPATAWPVVETAPTAEAIPVAPAGAAPVAAGPVEPVAAGPVEPAITSARFCPGCGAPVAAGHAFCPRCGMRVPTAAA